MRITMRLPWIPIPLTRLIQCPGMWVIEVVYENHPVKGNLKIVKQGEVLDGFSKDFVYEVENLAGAVFDVYACGRYLYR